jgi:hypothetical protein
MASLSGSAKKVLDIERRFIDVLSLSDFYLRALRVSVVMPNYG